MNSGTKVRFDFKGTAQTITIDNTAGQSVYQSQIGEQLSDWDGVLNNGKFITGV